MNYAALLTILLFQVFKKTFVANSDFMYDIIPTTVPLHYVKMDDLSIQIVRHSSRP